MVEIAPEIILVDEAREEIHLMESKTETVSLVDNYSVTLTSFSEANIKNTDDIALDFSNSVLTAYLTENVKEEISNAIKIGTDYPSLSIDSLDRKNTSVFLEKNNEAAKISLKELSKMWTKIYNEEDIPDIDDVNIGDYICKKDK